MDVKANDVPGVPLVGRRFRWPSIIAGQTRSSARAVGRMARSPLIPGNAPSLPLHAQTTGSNARHWPDTARRPGLTARAGGRGWAAHTRLGARDG